MYITKNKLQKSYQEFFNIKFALGKISKSHENSLQIDNHWKLRDTRTNVICY